MKRAAVVWIAAGAVVAAAAVGVTAWALTRGGTPDQTAEAYLSALSSGDAAALREVLVEPDERVLEAFEGATSYVSDYSFDLAEDGSARAEVELAGAPAVVGFQVADTGDGYAVTADFLATVEVSTTVGDAVSIGGVVFPVAEPVHLLPAEYVVAAAPAGVLEGATPVAVTNEVPMSAAVEASLSPDATALAQDRLDAYAEACAAPATAVPDACGIRVPWAVDLASLESIAFRVEQLPQLVLSADGTTFDATGGVIVATATGPARDGTAGRVTYRADDWALRGTVRFTGDEMVLAVR
jgi:hypothetical protein